LVRSPRVAKRTPGRRNPDQPCVARPRRCGPDLQVPPDPRV